MERKDRKIEFPTYCGIFSSKYLTIVAKIRGVLETRGDADEDEVGGLDRIAISPSLQYFLYTIFRSSNDSDGDDLDTSRP